MVSAMPFEAITSLGARALAITAHPLLHPVASPQVAQASLSIPDTLFLFVVALVVFGPKRLPEIGKQIGKLVFEFRRASNDFKLQIEEELRLSEQQEKQKTLELQAAAAAKAAAAAPVAELAAPAGVPAATEPPNEEKGLVIQPPSSGTLVEARPPNRSVVEAGSETSPASPGPEHMTGNGIGGSTPELREALARGTAVENEAPAADHEHNPSESATTHHG